MCFAAADAACGGGSIEMKKQLYEEADGMHTDVLVDRQR